MIIRDKNSEEKIISYLGIQMPLFFSCTRHKWHQLAQGMDENQSPVPSCPPLPTLLEVSSGCPRNHTLPVPSLPGTFQSYIEWTQAQLAEPVSFRDIAPDPEEAEIRAQWDPASLSMLGMVPNQPDMSGPR